MLMVSLLLSTAPLVSSSSSQVFAYNWAPLLVSNSGDSVAKVSIPFNYSGYSFPEYENFTKISTYAPMSDGALIAVDIFLPTGYNGTGDPAEEFPVVLEYTPYVRATINPLTGEVNDRSSNSRTQLLLAYGYAYIVADFRGTGASTGWRLEFMPRIHQDGGELVDWIAAQPWCDGNVGMTGGSYVGWSQTATAGQMPEALKCIAPQVIAPDIYTGVAYPGGIYMYAFNQRWSSVMFLRERNFFIPGVLDPTAPAIDEDGDGMFHDEIPLDLDYSGTFLDDYHPLLAWPPQYFDGNGSVRQHLYYFATLEHHLGNVDYTGYIQPYIDTLFTNITHPYSGTVLNYTSYEISPSGFMPNIMESGIPIYDIGAWFDAFTRGTTELYCTMQETNPSKMVMFPGYHNVLAGPFWEYLGEEPPNLDLELLRFFDRYLKGIENGIDEEPPIYIYVMNGEGWRFEDAWPLPQQQITNFYFEEGNTLATERMNEGWDIYTADYTHDSRYGTNQAARLLPFPNLLPIRTEKDLQCLTYTSTPMVHDTEVTGYPIIHLWVSSTADYGDFHVFLEDVDENGEAILITEGHLRAGFAELYDNDEMINSGETDIDMLPDLPWHGYEQAEYVDAIFADGNIVELVIDFHPTSWVFKEGHSIRVSIACADWPVFELHPELCPTNNPFDPNNIVPNITVYYDAEHESFIELPVIPPADRVFEGYARVNTPELKYRGPAELYTFETAVYLHFGDQWIKWNVTKHYQKEFTFCKFNFIEFYKCIGEQGRLRVTIFHNEHCSSATAAGRNVLFFGSAI